MLIHIDDAVVREELVAFLRARACLATLVDGAVLAQPLNTVSDRYDRRALVALLEEWKHEHGRGVDLRFD
jgi:hypothetical protein